MAPDSRPPFATYLLPSFTLPFRRRQSSTTSNISNISSTLPSLSFSPRSSISTSPGSSPPTSYNIPHQYPALQKGLLHEALQQENTQKGKEETKLYRAQPNTLKCVYCATDIAFAAQIVSKGFTGRHGRAYLVSPPETSPYIPAGSKRDKQKEIENEKGLVNTKIGRSVNRELLTGAHVVADVSCVICCTVLGWKYVDAKEATQRYKIGKFILEMKRVVLGVGWEDGIEGEDEVDEVVEEEGEYDNEKDAEEEDDVIVFDEDDEDECEDLFTGVWDAEIVAKRRGKRFGGRR